MNFSPASHLFLLSVTTSLLAPCLFAADRVVGTNATLETIAGARSAGVGGAAMAVDEDYLELSENPYQLARVQNGWAAFSHVAYYEGTQYDYASAVFPLGPGQGLGIGFSRFGADDIPWIPEGEPIPEGSDYSTFSIADYVLSLDWGRRFGKLEAGLSFHGLYRDLGDQTGWGFRGDMGARYPVFRFLDVSALLKGWTSSAATWESDEFEYSSPELYIAGNFKQSVPYFYGTLRLLWQSAGFFHREDRNESWDGEAHGGRLWRSPVDWLAGGRAGAEFDFDFGLSLRGGLAEIGEPESWTAGAGLKLSNWFEIDYAFESHPELSAVHRVSLQVSPGLFLYPPKKSAAAETLGPAPAKMKSVSQEEPLETGTPEVKAAPEEESAGGTWEE